MQACIACRNFRRYALLGSFPLLVHAAEDTPAVGPSAVSLVSLLQVVFALALVLGAIVAFAWFVRRFVPGQAGPGGLLKVVGGVMVGPKERLVVVEVGETWLLLGVAASNVTLVHSMPRPADAPALAAGTQPNAFQRLLRHALAGKRQND